MNNTEGMIYQAFKLGSKWEGGTQETFGKFYLAFVFFSPSLPFQNWLSVLKEKHSQIFLLIGLKDKWRILQQLWTKLSIHFEQEWISSLQRRLLNYLVQSLHNTLQWRVCLLYEFIILLWDVWAELGGKGEKGRTEAAWGWGESCCTTWEEVNCMYVSELCWKKVVFSQNNLFF